MNNMNPPRGGDPQDFWPTQELGPAAARPGPGGGPSGPPRSPRRGRRGLWWGAGLALVALLAGGGAVAVAALTSSSTPSGPTGQAAVLNTMLSSASSPASAGTTDSIAAGTDTATNHPCLSRAKKLRAAGHPAAARAALRRCHPLRRVRALGGIHGEFTFQTKKGSRTIAYERGVIVSVTSSAVVVRAADNTTLTWALKSNTVVRQNGKSSSTSALSDGERVFVAGAVVSGSHDARVIVIRPASGSSPTPGSSASGS
ncbi:MAG TPA: hypothetical protein VH480_14960 [Streptosporangiaceae bacterium]